MDGGPTLRPREDEVARITNVERRRAVDVRQYRVRADATADEPVQDEWKAWYAVDRRTHEIWTLYVCVYDEPAPGRLGQSRYGIVLRERDPSRDPTFLDWYKKHGVHRYLKDDYERKQP